MGISGMIELEDVTCKSCIKKTEFSPYIVLSSGLLSRKRFRVLPLGLSSMSVSITASQSIIACGSNDGEGFLANAPCPL